MAEKNLEQKHIRGEAEVEETPFFQDVNFDWRNLSNRSVYVHHTLIGSDAATAGNYGTFWIAPFRCSLVGVDEIHQAKGTDAGSVGLNIEKLTDGTALDSGTEMLSSNIDLKADANTVQSGIVSRKDRQIERGEHLALKDSGTLTSVSNVTVVLELKIRQ